MNITKSEVEMCCYIAKHGVTIGNRMKVKFKNRSRTAKKLKEKGLVRGIYIEDKGRPVEELTLTKLGEEFVSLVQRMEEEKK